MLLVILPNLSLSNVINCFLEYVSLRFKDDGRN